jgi:hypothetical protein
MRDLGPFDKKTPSADVKPRKWPKPDFVHATLTAPELHAYYIAVISSALICASPDGLHLKAS